MPIIYALGIGLVLLSMKHKIREVWNTLVIVLIWLNIGALLWRLLPQLHPVVLGFWTKVYSPADLFIGPLINTLKSIVTNLSKVFSGMGVK